jgi:uncharacterized membrane protein YebE (DUF533 family)
MTAGEKKALLAALLALGLLAGAGAVAAIAYSMASSPNEKKKETTVTTSTSGPPPPPPRKGSYGINPFNPYGTGYEFGKKILGKG